MSTKRWIGLAVLAAGCAPAEPETASVTEAIYTGGEQIPEEGPKDDGSGGSSCRFVHDRDELLDALADRHQGWVCVPGDIDIDMTGCRDVKVHPGTKLWGGRTGTLLGARLFTRAEEDVTPGEAECPCAEGECEPDHDGNFAIFQVTRASGEANTGAETRIEGFRLHGPYTSHAGGPISLSAVQINTHLVRHVVITGNELSGFSLAAVRIIGSVDRDVVYPEDCFPPAPNYQCGTPMTKDEAEEILVSQNYIHHNVRDGLGYGVAVGRGAYASIEGNVFDYNRHAVSHDGKPFSGYIARNNYVLHGGHCEDRSWGCFYNQHFDVHGSDSDGYGGVGGEYFEVAGNTIRGHQPTEVIIIGAPPDPFAAVRPAFRVRGEPTDVAIFQDNVLEHDDADEAVKTSHGGEVALGPNRYDEDTTHDLAVGDFDGDGKDDVFIATGTAWFYSSGAKTEWRFLKATTLPIERLGFGDFDGDGKTDVFWRRNDGQWFFVSAGRGVSQELAVSQAPFEHLRFADFDGDGITDVFRANGTLWAVSWGGRTHWEKIADSVVEAGSLRLGDFDGDRIADVFAIGQGGTWRWSRSGRSLWATLNASVSTDLASLVFGNFDGDDGDGVDEPSDRTTDVALRGGDLWRYSRGGAGGLITLRSLADQPGYADPTKCWIGNFDGSGGDDCLRYEQTRLWITDTFVPDRFFWRWTRGSAPFVQWSRHPMR